MGWHKGQKRKRATADGSHAAKGGKGNKGGGGWKAGGKSGKEADGQGGKDRGGSGHGGKAGDGARRHKPLPQQGWLVSSETPAQCRRATREALDLLRDALEEAPGASGHGPAAPADSEGAAAGSAGACRTTTTSTAKLLEAELLELRGETGSGEGAASIPKRPRIAFHAEATRGVAVLAGPPKVETPATPAPSELARRVFTAQGAAPRDAGPGVRAVRFVVRLLPLDFVCSPHLSSFRAAAAAALPRALAGVQPSATWYCAFHARAMGTIKREDALAVLKEIINPLGLELSVSEAEYMVVVEVNPLLCGFSVLQGYYEELHECHLQRASEAGRLARGEESPLSDSGTDPGTKEEEEVDEEDGSLATSSTGAASACVVDGVHAHAATVPAEGASADRHAGHATQSDIEVAAKPSPPSGDAAGSG